MARGRTAGTRKRGRAATARDAPPDVFRDMLGELDPQAIAAPSNDQERSAKRQRIGVSARGRGGSRTATKDEKPQSRPHASKATTKAPAKIPAKVVPPKQRSDTPESDIQEIDFNPESSSDDDAEESDEFEDVVIGDQNATADEAAPGAERSGPEDTLDLVLGSSKEADKTPSRRRRAATVITDKSRVLQAHKLHLLCLLSHLSLRNHWCNDVQVQRALRRITPRKARVDMEDDENEDQLTRDQKLRSGLRQAMKAFEENFRKTAKGLRRSWWDVPENDSSTPALDDLDLLTSVDDFRTAAREMVGSRDVGAQLFCAMLRGLGHEVRLVFSLQPLPLNGSIRPQAPDQPPPAQRVRYEDTRVGMGQGEQRSSYEHSPDPTKEENAWNVSSIRRRLGGGSGSSILSEPQPMRSYLEGPKRFRESSQPIYWVEVFSPAYQKWICVDPLVTESLGQPSKLEPAQRDIRNSLSYVVGMEEDGSVRDITRRYAAHFNAKNRKLRLDAIADSDAGRWWNHVLRIYRRSTKLDRDDIEDAEMQRRSEREGMPKNVEDFKGHPIYVLERHLRRNEVVHPKREVGRTGAGKTGDEIVFRRRDVHVVKSADAWYRVGRELKVGEQPLKRHVPKRKTRPSSPRFDDEEDEDSVLSLYAIFQTDIYRAPPVKNGVIPRNAYGNLDVYVPSMIPPGAVHFLRPSTKHAAKILGIDFVDAVTGFEFKGRQGNPVIRGAIVAAEYKEAVLEVLLGMANEQAAAEADFMQRECLRLWRRFLTGLKVRERIFGQDAEDADDSDEGSDGEFKIGQAMDEDYQAHEAEAHEGGFMSEDKQTESSPSGGAAFGMPTIDGSSLDFTVIEGPSVDAAETTRALKDLKSDPIEGQAAAGGFLPESSGGFLPEQSGGFLPDSNQTGVVQTGVGGPDGAFDEESLFGDTPEDVSGQNSPRDIDADMADKGQDKQAAVQVSEPSVLAEPEHLRPSPQQAEVKYPTQLAGNTDAESSHATVDDDEEQDRGSLLSEDPEDSDAIPDWLA